MPFPTKTMLLFAAVAGCIAAFGLLLHIMLQRKRRKADKEQMGQYMREEALNQALANHQHHASGSEPQQPVDILYGTDLKDIPKGAKILRLTEACKDSTVTRQYLFRVEKKVFIGSQDGRGAVLHQRTVGSKIFCELFSLKEEIYARHSGTEARLVRGKKSTVLVSSGIQLRSGDVIETPCGSYQIEIIQI